MCSGDIRILGRATQSLAGEANTVPRAEMPILGRDINPVGADALWVRSCIQLVFFRLSDQVFSFVVGGSSLCGARTESRFEPKH